MIKAARAPAGSGRRARRVAVIRYKLAVGLAVLCAACAVLSGCTGLPDRGPQVQRLEAEISAMPGVDDVSSIYSNDFTAGSNLTLTVSMPAASDAQIAEVATRINDLKQDDFDGYRQMTEFKIGDRLMLKLGAELNSGRIAELARRLRQIGLAIPTAQIDWLDGELELRNAPDVAGSLAAVRTGLGNEPVRVNIMTHDSAPMWTVDFPFSSQQEKNIRSQLSGLPVDVASVEVENGRLSSLSVGVRHPKTAYQDLSALIGTVRPTREHPMRLEWDWNGTDEHARQFSGQVHVAGCRYGDHAGEKDPARYYTPGAIDLQRRLRNEFDACP